MESLYVIDFLITWEIDPNNTIKDIIVFDGYLNIQLGGENLKFYYTRLTVVMHRVEQTVSLFFNDASKIPIVYQTIRSHK